MTDEAIDRAKSFLRDMPYIILDESVPFENYLDFSEPHKPYYVYMDSESCGCFENEAKFMSAKEVNEVIKTQLVGRNKWDHVIIFDVNKNEIITPKIG